MKRRRSAEKTCGSGRASQLRVRVVQATYPDRQVMGGSGWAEHRPKCTKARNDGWKQRVNVQHSLQCRRRIGAELAQTELGQARLEHTNERVDRCAAGIGDRVVPSSATAADARPEGGWQCPNSKKSIQRLLHRQLQQRRGPVPVGPFEVVLKSNTYLMNESEEHAASSQMSQAPAKPLQTLSLRDTTP